VRVRRVSRPSTLTPDSSRLPGLRSADGGSFCNGATLQEEGTWRIQAIRRKGHSWLAAKASLTIEKLDSAYHFIGRCRLIRSADDDDRSAHTGQPVAYVKGAPDVLLALYASAGLDGTAEPSRNRFAPPSSTRMHRSRIRRCACWRWPGRLDREPDAYRAQVGGPWFFGLRP
jgi:hypothetical protein